MLERITITFKTKKQTKHKRNKKKIHHNVLHTKTFRIELKTFEVFFIRRRKKKSEFKEK